MSQIAQYSNRPYHLGESVIFEVHQKVRHVRHAVACMPYRIYQWSRRLHVEVIPSGTSKEAFIQSHLKLRGADPMRWNGLIVKVGLRSSYEIRSFDRNRRCGATFADHIRGNGEYAGRAHTHLVRS